MQGALTVFEIGKAIRGDVTVGLFLGDHKREWDAPALAYAFNANFAEAGVVRLNAGDVDLPCGQVDALAADAAGFWMDLVFDEESVPDDR